MGPRPYQAGGSQSEDAGNRPYWQYDALNDGRTRPAHAALDGKIFRHDDPIWDTHYPPNGFNCRCMVHALTAADLKAAGLRVSNSQGKLSQVDQHVGVDKQTGEVINRKATAFDFIGPDGRQQRLTPDPGWNYNPGKGAPPFDPPPLPAAANNPADLPIELPPLKDRAKQVEAFYKATESPGFKPLYITRGDGEKDRIYTIISTPDGQPDIALTDKFIKHVVVDHTKRSFQSEAAPDGTPWAELSEVTRGRRLGKIANADRRQSAPVPILQDNRDLIMSILPDWDRTTAVVGTNLKYATTHQFGAEKGSFGTTRRGIPIPWGDIPARPFLGLAPADFPKVEGILSDFIRRKWRESA